MLSRRTLLRSSAAAAAAVAPMAVLAQTLTRDLHARLQADLDARLHPGTDTALAVRSVMAAEADGRVRLGALVEMHWRPGLRRRPFEATGASEEAAYLVLRDRCIATFRAPNPGAFL